MYDNKNSNTLFNSAKKKKASDNFVFLWSLTAILISVLISFAILFAVNPTFIADFISNRFGNLAKNIQDTPGLPPILGGKKNILILGIDSNQGSSSDPFRNARSDSMILVTINPLTKTANAISIPRDSKVYIADNHGIDKINAAHSYGGPELVVKTVEQTFGVKINHYIDVDYAAVRKLVKALGGVYINVEKRMRYVDHAARLNIDLYPGYQLLNAKQAEGYLRFRHDAVGDIGRMRRQQWFVNGVLKKLQSPEIIPKIPQLIQLLSKHIKTDMNFYELSQLATYSKIINLDEIQTSTLPGKPSKFGHISYWILDTNKTQEIIDRLVYGADGVVKDTPISVGILYSRSLESRVPEFKSTLEQLGYVVTCNAVTKEPHSQIMAHSSYASYKVAKLIKESIPELKNAQFAISSNSNVCGRSDFTLVLTGN